MLQLRQLCWRGRRMRRRHEYAAADAARISLLLNGVVVEDGPGGESVWVRLPDYGDTSPRKRILHLPKAGCMFWSHKKRSFCKNTREPHQYFCAFHIASRGDLTGKMPCPLDPRHSIRPAKGICPCAHLPIASRSYRNNERPHCIVLRYALHKRAGDTHAMQRC